MERSQKRKNTSGYDSDKGLYSMKYGATNKHFYRKDTKLSSTIYNLNILIQ